MGQPEPDDLPALKVPRIQVTVAITDEGESNFYVGVAEKVSGGGVFVATHALMSIGSAIDLSVLLPGQEPIRARATVRWLRYGDANGTIPGMGIRFDRLSSGDARRILNFAEIRPPMIVDDEARASGQILSPWALVG
jgi:uncharacterized protein (TIGR02266 family)